MKSALLFLQLVSFSSLPQSESWSLADRLAGRIPPAPRGGRRFVRHIGRRAVGSDDSQESGSRSTSTKTSRQDMLDFMSEPVDNLVADRDVGDSGDDDLVPLVECIIKAADGRKAEDIVALQVHHISTLSSVLIILSGNSRPQNQAIAAAITKDVQEEFGERPGGSGVPEGSAESGWILLDYGNVMVHIMTPKSRLFYNVEGQWLEKGGIKMDFDYLIVPNTLSSTGESTSAEPSPEDDPFWS